MPTLEYFVVCRGVSLDVDTDEITLSNVIEDVYLDRDGPTTLPRAVAVGSWNIESGEQPQDQQVILRITIPGRADGIDFPTNLEIGRHRFRTILGVLEIPIVQEGMLSFELLLNSRHVAYHKVHVHPAEVRATHEPPLREPPAETITSPPA